MEQEKKINQNKIKLIPIMWRLTVLSVHQNRQPECCPPAVVEPAALGKVCDVAYTALFTELSKMWQTDVYLNSQR